MNTIDLRERLYQQLEELPDDIVDEIADFTAFVAARRRMPATYLEWTDHQWGRMMLGQFLRDTDDDIEYTIDDSGARNPCSASFEELPIGSAR